MSHKRKLLLPAQKSQIESMRAYGLTTLETAHRLNVDEADVWNHWCAQDAEMEGTFSRLRRAEK